MTIERKRMERTQKEKIKFWSIAEPVRLRIEFIGNAMHGKEKSYEYRLENDLSPLSAQDMMKRGDFGLSCFVSETPNYIIFNELWLNACKEGLFERLGLDIDPLEISDEREKQIIEKAMKKELSQIGALLGLQLINVHYNERPDIVVESNYEDEEEVNRSWAIFKKGGK
jgi:hypothetical protein